MDLHVLQRVLPWLNIIDTIEHKREILEGNCNNARGAVVRLVGKQEDTRTSLRRDRTDDVEILLLSQ